MKNLLLFLLGIVLLTSCAAPTKREKMMTSITEYLKKTLDDPASYESASFGVPYAVYTRAEAEDFYTSIEDTLYERRRDSARYSNSIAYFVDKTSEEDISSLELNQMMLKMNQDIIDKLVASRDSFVTNYPKTHIGYYLDHDFRANNKLGAKVMEKAHFIMDTTYAVKDVYEEQPILTYNYEIIDFEEK